MVFAPALRVLFASALSKPATYTPAAGDPISCRVILSRTDDNWTAFQVGAVSSAIIAEVLASAVASPAEGDTLTVNGTAYEVTKVTSVDGDGLVWRLELS